MIKQIILLFIIFIVHLFVGSDAQAQSIFTTHTKNFGGTQIETKMYLDEEISKMTITNKKQTYQVGIYKGAYSGQKITGDIKLPRKNSEEYKKLRSSGAFATKSNYSSQIEGLKAQFVQIIPGLGLVGIIVAGGQEQRDAYKFRKVKVVLGRAIWQLDPATGEVKHVAKDEVVIFNPYHRIYSSRLLYIDQSAGTDTSVYGALFEENRPVRQWDNLSVMAPKRYYRYIDGYIQLADQTMGETYEVVVFNDELKINNIYFPALLVYKNYDKMPSIPYRRSSKDLIADYRGGQSEYGADQLFSRQVLVPNQDIEGLYGVLQEDGTIEIPKGSLGLSPVITEESKFGKPYLLSHFFLVAYPGEDDGRIHYAVANSEGKLSYGSQDQPVWKQFMIYESELVKKHNSHSYVHPELIVAQLPNGLWHCYLASRYGHVNNSHENLIFYFPRPVGESAETEAEAISSAEEELVQIDKQIGKYNAKRAAIREAEAKANIAADIARKNKEMEEWRKSNPNIPSRRTDGGGGSTWRGFTNTKETTSRYNQSVNQSNYNNNMRQYNNYLNSRIYRKW